MKGERDKIDVCHLAHVDVILDDDERLGWVIDSCSWRQICCSREGFKEKWKLRNKDVDIILGDLNRLYVKAKGDVTLVFQDKSSLTLQDYIYVPKMRRNIILTYCLYEDGFRSNFFFFFYKASIMKNDREVCQAHAVNETYMLHPKTLVELPKQEEKLNKKCIVNNPTFLWH